MLLRLASRSVFMPKSTSVFKIAPFRSVTYINNEAIPLPSPTDAPQRDHVNFPRIKRPDFHPPVRFLFIPDTWFTFFYNKIGVTGPYTLGIGFFSFLLSKELLLWYDHEITHLKTIIMWAYILYITDMGHFIWHKYHQWMVKENEDEYIEFWDTLPTDLQQLIEVEKSESKRLETKKDLLSVNREGIDIQLEAIYRKRAMDLYSQVKRKLDYHVEIATVVDRMKQKYMVDWVIDSVKTSITPEQERESLKKCIADLQLLATKV